MQDISGCILFKPFTRDFSLARNACVIFLFVLAFIPTAIFSQPGDSIAEPNLVVIYARQLKFQPTGKTSTLLDSTSKATLQFGNLGQAIAQFSNAFIKNYGPSSISTVSFRGTGPEHTKILWNGIPLNSPAMGLCDLSVLPVELFEDVQWINGGCGSLFGSSSTGGLISLSNDQYSTQENKFRTGFFGGSFGLIKHYSSLQLRSAKLQSNTLFFYQGANNRYPFPVNFPVLDGNFEKMPNAKSNSGGFAQTLTYTPNARNKISASFWLQKSHRQIPLTGNAGTDAAFQNDSTAKTSLSWTHYMLPKESKAYRVAGQIDIRAGWSAEYIRYSDSNSFINSKTWMGNGFLEAEIKNPLNEWVQWNAGISMNHLRARSENYGGLKSENRAAAFAGLETKFRKINSIVSVNLRQDAAQNVLAPFSPGIGIEKSFSKIKPLLLRASFNRVFNLPTLNMKFWSPGGNPAILPEKGWSADAGADLKFSGKNWTLYQRSSVFSILLNNWIQWQPQTNGLWSPMNLKRVWSRGIESSFQLSWKPGNFILLFSGNYSMTFATNVEVKDASLGDILGKQLMYVPRHQLNSNFTANWKKFSISINGSFTGKRFTSTDNYFSQAPYWLCHLSISKRLDIRRNHFSLSARVDNLFNQFYAASGALPMPGRTFSLGLRMEFSPLKFKSHSKNP